MKLYENIFIVRQDLSPAQVNTVTTDVTKFVTDAGGEVGKVEYCGLLNLAYQIKKNRKGHYTLMNVTAPPSAIAEIERKMRLNEDILRHLMVSTEAHSSEPSILMQQSQLSHDSPKESSFRHKDRERMDDRSGTTDGDNTGKTSDE